MSVHRKRSSALILALILGVIVVASGVLVAIFAVRGGHHDGGVLQDAEPSSTITLTGFPVDEGDVVSVGVYVTVPQGGADDLVLDGVRLLGAPPEVTLEGAFASTGRGQSFACVGAARRFPPPGCRLFELEGWTVSNEAFQHGSFQLVLGLSIDLAGSFGFPGVLLDYHRGGEQFTAVFLQGAELCAPRSLHAAGCPGKDELIAEQERIADLMRNGSFEPPREDG